MARSPVVYLIDGHVWIFRAYFTLPEMPAPDGTHTGAAYGFTNMLLRFLAEEKPKHLALTFDYALESFRNEIDPEYKANREDAPPDLEPQFDFCSQAAQALGVPVFEKEGFEADDLLGTLTHRLLKKNARVVVVTSDKDLTQLVTEDGRVIWRDYARETQLDADGVREKFGVSPGQIPDFLGLAGDSVDNLPGVPGVGPKGAAAALQAFGRIEDIPSNPDAWEKVTVRGKARLAALIGEHRERALLSRKLATVHRNVPGVRVDLRSLRYQGARRPEVDELFDRLGWGAIRNRVPIWQTR